MRIVIGSIMHESNTFSTVRTTLDDFGNRVGGDEVIELYEGTGHPVGGFLAIARREGIDLVPAIVTNACPSGPVTDHAFQFLKDKLLRSIEDAGHLDGVLLALHGAMVTESLDDPEGTILEEVRTVVGEDVYIVSSLDSHANLSPLMVRNADVLVGYRTTPHVDRRETGEEAARILIALIRKHLSPVTAMEKIPLLLSGRGATTDSEPMLSLLKKAKVMEKKPGVISLSVFTGYTFADVTINGPGIVVVTDNKRELAENMANDLAREMWRVRNQFHAELVPIPDAIDQAIGTKGGPVIIADVGDNPCGGGSGDVTVLLEHLIKKGVSNTAVALFVDPDAVAKSIQAGVGEYVSLHLGGKIDVKGGKPLRVKGRVRVLFEGRFRHQEAVARGTWEDMGRTAVIDIDGIDVIIVEKAIRVSDPAIFSSVGIEPRDKKIVVVKDGLQFLVCYQSFAKKIIFADTPGWTSPNLSRLAFKHIQRPVFPLDKNTELRDG